ncbi:restriction endonuclease subunit S [Sporolactobacillus sp. CPB3-1]|uniref:Restriction endonuclease subunit S n=1 Tax=Sporolactobacillus mangiferae TaxID=2940498 RepID=A0ABT0MD55_9BACL|nr:restriction endonuclease subunit S [Sporolactobacillus mangiferae]MCL1632805.1 restriction endonuclease subunit S [Sporolactobacillus mangiferae]
MEKRRNAPEIRFDGFFDDWEQRNWENTVDISTNMVDPKTGEYDELPHIGPGNIESFSGRLLNNVNNVAEDKLISGKFHFNAGDIIYGKINPQLGKYVYASYEGLASADTYVLNAKNGINQKFLYTMLQTRDFYKYSVSVSMRTGVPKINRDELNMYNFNAPSEEEQIKIGTFFQTLDQTIALHQEKLDKLRRLKKAFLQLMFPQNGETEPRLRFANFFSAWEQRKLGKVADIIGGGTPSTSNEDYWDGDIDWYSPVEIGEQTYVENSQKKITELGLQKSSARILPVGTVLFTSRAGIGNTAILAKEGTTNQGFQSIVPHKDELDSYFIYSRTHELKRYGEKKGAGSTFAEVSGKQMSKMPILIPNLEEQVKIGTFFAHLDHTLALHHERIEKLKKLKKAYLQDMLI